MRVALKDDGFWNTAIMQQARFSDLRRMAAEVTTRHPSVSAGELARVSVVIAPEIEHSKQTYQSSRSDMARAGAIMVTTLTALALALVLCFSAVSSVIVPGGVVTRLVGLAVVTRDGEEVRRWRSLLRVLLAWLPAIAWLVYLVASPKIQGWVPAPGSPVMSVSLALGALAIGATWSILRPTRGPHDRLVGSWIVPR